jgi:hypothetical protein
MSYENEQELQDGTGAEGADEGAGADDLNGGMGGEGDMEIAPEPKRPVDKGTIIVVALLVACGGVLYFMYARSGPAEAVAANSGANQQVIEGFLKDSEQNVKKMRDLIQSTEKVVHQFRTEPPQVKTLAANPFQAGEAKPSEDRAAADKERKKQMAAAKIKEAVDGLRLQTIIARDPKKAQCMINNFVYRKGNKITVGPDKITFTVDEITSEGVTVSAPAGDESVKFELKMKQ